MSRELTLTHMAQTALDVQSACNLSGVVRSFAEITAALRASGLDTPTTNTHPICRLFAEQILHLTGGGSGDTASYETAYVACTTLAKGQPQREPHMAALARVFGDEWTALDAADQKLIIRDCTEDGGVSDLAAYAGAIGRGNLASYVKTQRVRFGKPPHDARAERDQKIRDGYLEVSDGAGGWTWRKREETK